MHDPVVGTGGDHVTAPRVEHQIDLGDHGTELVGARHQPAIDAAVVGAVRVAAHHQVDRLVEALDDVDDSAADARAFVVVAGREAAFVDQQHDRLDALLAQLRHEFIHRLGLVAEAQATHARRHDDARRVFQRQADEGDRNALEGLDVIRRQQRLAAALVDRARGEVLERRTLERLRPFAALRGRTAATLQAQQFVAAAVEFVVADGRNLQPHRAERLDRRLVAEQRREQRAGADQVTRADEHVVSILAAQLGHRRRQVLGATRRHVDRLRRIGRVPDADAAQRWKQVAVEVIDGEHLHRHRRRRARRHARACGESGGKHDGDGDRPYHRDSRPIHGCSGSRSTRAE